MWHRQGRTQYDVFDPLLIFLYNTRTYMFGTFFSGFARLLPRCIWVVTHISSSLGRNENSNFHFASELSRYR